MEKTCTVIAYITYVYVPLRLVPITLRQVHHGLHALALLIIGTRSRRLVVFFVICYILWYFGLNFVIFPNNYKTVAYALYGADCSSTLCLPSLNGNSLSLQCLSTATESNCPNTLTGYHCDCLSTQYYDTTYGWSMKLNNIL